MLEVTIIKKGPIFDGRAKKAIDGFIDDVTETLANRAFERVHMRLRRSLKNPTGAYQSMVRITNRQDTLAIVNPMIYHPWIEGRGSRNYPVTSFKGYKVFATTQKEIDREARAIARGKLPKWLKQMNG